MMNQKVTGYLYQKIATKIFKTYLNAYHNLCLIPKKVFVSNIKPNEHLVLNNFHYLKNVRQIAPSTKWYINKITILIDDIY